ncbi:MAG: tetratricopeptide repeat protein [Candidatus Obscuribacter sp.]|nr:tetratricopeptide repeat protein [Candidatus Obscuribacter sp.]
MQFKLDRYALCTLFVLSIGVVSPVRVFAEGEDDVSAFGRFTVRPPVHGTKPTKTSTAYTYDQPKEFLAELYPNNSAVLDTLRREYERQGNWRKALEYHKRYGAVVKPGVLAQVNAKAVDLSKDGLYMGTLGFYELQTGDYQSAVRDLTTALELLPNWSKALKNRAAAYVKLGKFDLAKKDQERLQELIKSGKGVSNYTYQSELARVNQDRQRQSGQFEVSVANGLSALKKNPSNQYVLLHLVSTYLNMGEYQKALVYCQKLVALSPGNAAVKKLADYLGPLAKKGPPAYGDLSVLDKPPVSMIITLVDGKKTIVPASKFASMHKGDARVYDAIAVKLWQLSRVKESDAELEKMLLVNQTDLSLLRQKVQTSEALHLYQDVEDYATAYLEQAAADSNNLLNPDTIQYIYTVRKKARADRGDYAKAIADCNVLLKFDPTSAEVFRDRADYNMKLAKYELAVADYTQSIKYDDTKTSPNYRLRAKAYEKLKKFDLAKRDTDTANKLDKE